jgi:hypothetical protein
MFLPEIKFERQTILATKYAGEILGDPFGYPLRLRTSTKLGYKNAKWIRAIEVSNDFRKTYWSERGFNWYVGNLFDRGRQIAPPVEATAPAHHTKDLYDHTHTLDCIFGGRDTPGAGCGVPWVQGRCRCRPMCIACAAAQPGARRADTALAC